MDICSCRNIQGSLSSPVASCVLFRKEHLALVAFQNTWGAQNKSPESLLCALAIKKAAPADHEGFYLASRHSACHPSEIYSCLQNVNDRVKLVVWVGCLCTVLWVLYAKLTGVVEPFKSERWDFCRDVDAKLLWGGTVQKGLTWP